MTSLARRPRTQFLIVEHAAAISNPLAAAEAVNDFLGGRLDVRKMAARVDPALHRNKRQEFSAERLSVGRVSK
jgi:hypothetical protein